MNNKVLVAGCGLSGMIAALSFAAYGINTTIVEVRNVTKEGFPHDPRTTALNSNACDFFQKIKIWDQVATKLGRIDDIYVVDNKSNDMLHFTPKIMNNKKVMGHIIENDLFKSLLFKLVLENKHIRLIDNTEYKVVDKAASVELLLERDNQIIEADLLLVCNTHKSEVSNKYFSKKIDKEYAQGALVFNVFHEKKHECCAVEHFMPTGPFAILPMQDQHSSSIVWTVDKCMTNILLAMDKKEFTYNLQQNFGEFLGKVKLAGEIKPFPLKAYMAANIIHNRIVLLADSAHIIHPLAGQGLNQGIKDIQSLINNVIIYGFGSTALENYKEQRMKDNMRMFRITDTLNRVFSNKSRALFSLRRIGFKMIEKISPLKIILMSYAMGDFE